MADEKIMEMETIMSDKVFPIRRKRMPPKNTKGIKNPFNIAAIIKEL